MFEFGYYNTEPTIQDAELYSEEVSIRNYKRTRYEDFEIYTTYKKEIELDEYDNFVLEILNKVSEKEDIVYFGLPISSVLVVIIVTYLVISIGHTKGKEGIDTNDLDKIPFEILLTVIIVICYIAILIIDNITATSIAEYYKLVFSGIVTTYLIIYAILAILVTTFIKRIKSKTLLRTTIIGMFALWVDKIVNKINNMWIKAKQIKVTKNTTKLMIYIIGYIVLIITAFIIVSTILSNIIIGMLVDIIITIYVIYKILKRINCFERIEKQLKEIYEGNNSEKLDIESLTPEFKNMANYINDISNGFENAVQEGIKSERLKTELITNVSHDIKTPLTSIINYVDLLKQENIESEKAKEYIEILEAKSLRLKRLTEDLVEASKVSSGNVKLNLEKINIGELINQTTGEFEDKFKEKELEIITKLPQEEVFIEADSRYMFRVIENIFSNISKYAAKGTRVYIDIVTYEKKVNISIKNISSERLNISTEELMQRFVRGDKSRTTEGSGLGLSITRDLTELQKGKFEIQIDGDLFKVSLEFETM